MQGMSSIEKAVADSPLEDYQAIGQAAKKQVPETHCMALRWGFGKLYCVVAREERGRSAEQLTGYHPTGLQLWAE